MRRVCLEVKDRDMRNCGQGKEKVWMTQRNYETIVNFSNTMKDQILDLKEENQGVIECENTANVSLFVIKQGFKYENLVQLNFQ